MPLRTRTVCAPPILPRAMSMPRSSPITAMSMAGTASRFSSAVTAAREGLPSRRGRTPETLAMAAVIIEPRL
jgi:hypothetical protein